tara:strand:+ start:716 stop:1087 length:372 start_codon:yes stop_codon:yes gene_type:complete
MPKLTLKKRSPSLNDLKKRLAKLSKKTNKVVRLSKAEMINNWKTGVLKPYLEAGKYNSFSLYIIQNQDKLEACKVKKDKILEISKKSLKYNKYDNLVPHINSFTKEFKKVCGERAILCLAGRC